MSAAPDEDFVEIKTEHPSILFKINKSYRPRMTDVELYDATRQFWQIGVRRDEARYAIAVYGKRIIEVYRIGKWVESGKTLSTRANFYGGTCWEFVGRIAEEKIRRLYVGKLIKSAARTYEYLPRRKP